MGSSPAILDATVIPLVQGPRILDVGCGFGRWGVLLTTNYWETLGGKPAEWPEIVGCDGYLQNVEQCRKSSYYKQVLQLSFPPLPFSDASFNTVLLLDVIEHLNGNDGLRLIEESKRVAAHRVILSTPNWPAFRGAHRTITGLNEFEAHLSYWPRRRLRDLGFRLFGAGWRSGGRYWRIGLQKCGLTSAWDRSVRPSLMSLSRNLPFFAEHIVGFWEKR